MKKIIAILLSAISVISLAACAKSNQENSAAKDDTTQATVVETTAETKAPSVDVSSLNWVKGELKCYDYKYKEKPYYLSYSYPDTFKTATESYSGFQYFGYFYNPSDNEAKPNNSPYGLYIYFGQGSNGGMTKSSLEEDAKGGLKERDLGGRKVLFAELSPDPNTGSHTFAYYLSYEEDGWSRIWILVSDPEADGEFRKTFEKSMSFDKK
ncbi:MAG TPA: hypothetical protein DEO32_05420 [Ruminococcaceae bacterium]|nr:hypothetical protein [Oscillospiraceae bacterium]